MTKIKLNNSRPSSMSKSLNVSNGFTIVELLVVIVIIGILAAITIVSYTGVTQKANNAAIVSDLSSAKKQLAMYYTEYGSYPTGTLNANCPVTPNNDPKYCLKPSSGTDFSYSPGINGTTFGIRATKGTLVYSVTDIKAPNPTVDLGTDWITIGSQTWAKKNLNVGIRVDGTTTQTDNSSIEKYCYGDNPDNCTTYGALYQWNEAMQYSTNEGTQGICPTNSHIPSDNEWKILEMQLGMTRQQADAINWRGTDQGARLKVSGSSGLNVPLAGSRYPDGSFFSLSSYANLWSSSASSTNAWKRHLYSDLATVHLSTYATTYGFSVRCLGN